MSYRETIQSIDPYVNAVGVEYSMRMMYGTLDHLPREVFVGEVALAREMERAHPGSLQRIAISYREGWAYDRDEERIAKLREAAQCS